MVYIVLVNWRGYRDTFECLESLLRLDSEEYKVIVVDNESNATGVGLVSQWLSGNEKVETNGPPWKYLINERRRLPEVKVINNGENVVGPLPLITWVCVDANLGFAGANNIGIEIALKDDLCKYIWLLNNDTVVSDSALSALISHAKTDPAIGMCGSKLLYYDQPELIQSLGGKFNRYIGRGTNLWMGVNSKNTPSLNDLLGQMDFVIGASMFLTVDFIKSIGLMDDYYFLYFEELDWATRGKGLFKLSVALDSNVYHKEGGSIGTNSRGRSSNTSIYYMSINYLRYLKKFFPFLLPLGAIKMLASAGKYILYGDRPAFKVICHAMMDFSLGRRITGPYQK
jgi:GT2 family glycosyltransferase